VSRPLRFNARQVHLCCALWAIRALMGVLSSVYSVNRHFRLPCLQAGLPNSQPPTPDQVAVGDVPQYDLFPVELSKTAHFQNRDT
jgi:hypothetical protein